MERGFTDARPPDKYVCAAASAASAVARGWDGCEMKWGDARAGVPQTFWPPPPPSTLAPPVALSDLAVRTVLRLEHKNEPDQTDVATALLATSTRSPTPRRGNDL
nr:unnamed protein product [Digitaria exilis]